VGATFAGLLAGSLEETLAAGGLQVAAFFVTALWFSNLILVLFNMLPTFPMDGGRVLRALLSLRLDPGRAPAIAVVLGRVVLCVGVFALASFAPAFLLSNWMLLVVALFVVMAGQQELMAVRRRAAARRAAVPVLTLPVFSVEPGFSGVTWDEQSGVGIHWQDG